MLAVLALMLPFVVNWAQSTNYVGCVSPDVGSGSQNLNFTTAI